MKERIKKIPGLVIDYLKSLNWVVLIGIALFCIIFAIVNNIRVGEGKSVEWIGTQDVMEKPADIL